MYFIARGPSLSTHYHRGRSHDNRTRRAQALEQLERRNQGLEDPRSAGGPAHPRVVVQHRNEVVTGAQGQRTWAGSFVNTNERPLRDVRVTVDFLDHANRTVGKAEAQAAELTFGSRLDLQAPLPPDAVRLRIHSVQWRRDGTGVLMGPFREPWEFGYLMIDPAAIGG
jgi:hypothetical protein